MKKKRRKEKIIDADKKSAKINMKKLVNKKFEKQKENFRYTIFKDLVVKNLKEQTSAKYYINDTILSSNIIENLSFEF